MKERVVDRRYDPLVWLGRKIFRRDQLEAEAPEFERVHAPRTDVDHKVLPPNVTWHVPMPTGRDAIVGPDGRMPVTESTYDRAGAASPFGEDVTFPLPTTDLNYQHPSPDH
jgi:succinate dehydrogenase / fumarate reductase iron-sulfur subunit